MWASAAKAAERVYAFTAAAAYLYLAARNATSPGDLAEVRVALAHLSETRGQFAEVEELCDLAIEWFDGQGDERRSLTLRRLRERARLELGQPAKVTLEALASLDAEAKRLGFDHESVAILLMMSQMYGRLGDRRTSERIAAEGVAMAEQAGDTLVARRVRYATGWGEFSESPSPAYSILERALSLYEKAGAPEASASTASRARSWRARGRSSPSTSPPAGSGRPGRSAPRHVLDRPARTLRVPSGR